MGVVVTRYGERMAAGRNLIRIDELKETQRRRENPLSEVEFLGIGCCC